MASAVYQCAARGICGAKGSAVSGKFSSPTRMPLPPGAYNFWAQDPTNASRRGPEVLLRLGVARAETLDAESAGRLWVISLPTDSIGTRWKAISAVGAIVASTATAIYRPPPVGDPQSFIALGTLVSSVTSGLLYAP